MFENIVIVFFTTENVPHVYEMAFSIAKKYDAHVDVLKCIYKEPPKFVFYETKSEKKREVEQFKKAEASLKELEKIAQELGVTITTKLDITEELSDHVVSYVKSHKVDLIILDTSQHHEGELNKDLITRIFNEINCPLLTLQ